MEAMIIDLRFRIIFYLIFLLSFVLLVHFMNSEVVNFMYLGVNIAENGGTLIGCEH